MKKVFIYTLLALGQLMCATAQAQATFISGNDLINWIESDKRAKAITGQLGPEQVQDLILRTNLHAYIKGTADLMSLWESACVKRDVTSGQIVALTEKELAARPADWHTNASFFVFAALVKAFPCPKKP